jgi:hypothetical protein
MRDDLIDRLEAADPAAELEAYSETEVQAQLQAIRSAQPRIPRRRRRTTALALAATGLVAVALALLPADRQHRLPGPVEALAAKLAVPGGILHTVSDSGLFRTERWQALDGHASRELTRLGGGYALETVEDRHGTAVYSQRDDRLTRYARTDDGPRDGGADCWTCLVLAFDEHVRDGTLRRSGEATIQGRAAIVVTVEPQLTDDEPARLYVAADDGTLLRIEMDTARARPIRQDFVGFEVLEDTAANRGLLEMTSHPGADVVTAGRDTPPPP